jgi:hypothetical protein
VGIYLPLFSELLHDEKKLIHRRGMQGELDVFDEPHPVWFFVIPIRRCCVKKRHRGGIGESAPPIRDAVSRILDIVIVTSADHLIRCARKCVVKDERYFYYFLLRDYRMKNFFDVTAGRRLFFEFLFCAYSFGDVPPTFQFTHVLSAT